MAVTEEVFPLTSEQRKEREKAFIDSIDPEAVCQLASRLNGGKPCRIFKDNANGSFNVCFFVEFPDDGAQWVVRIAISVSTFDTWTKVQSEVATMKYIEAVTDIPIPHIHGFGRGSGTADEQNPTGQTYIAMDYVSGQSLDVKAFAKDTRERRASFYSQLIDIFAALRQLEFDQGGSLMPDPDGGSKPVVGDLLSIEKNELQMDCRDAVFPPVKFCSTSDFVRHQYDILAKTYDLPAEKQSVQSFQMEVFALNDLKERFSRLVDPLDDHGPFVLAHTDLRWPNIIVDENLTIRGIVDWEWASTVPRQLFMPPTWIAGTELGTASEALFRLEYLRFHQILRNKSQISPAYKNLADEWGPDLAKGINLPMASILRNPGRLVFIYFSCVYPKVFTTPRKEVVLKFFEDDGSNGLFNKDVERRMERARRHFCYLKENNLYVPDPEPQIAAEHLNKRAEIEKQFEKKRKAGEEANAAAKAVA